MIDFIISEKGEEVISERHQKDYKKEDQENDDASEGDTHQPKNTSDFTDVDFDDI